MAPKVGCVLQYGGLKVEFGFCLNIYSADESLQENTEYSTEV